ncbi:hypothetical protein HAX54_034513, partial [Datura stramonium]|nr:hypothetical protein [Datura stramonium]
RDRCKNRISTVVERPLHVLESRAVIDLDNNCTINHEVSGSLYESQWKISPKETTEPESGF